MSRQVGRNTAPADHVDTDNGGVWPHGPFVVGADAYVRYAAVLAIGLADAERASGLSAREFARTVGVPRTTVANLVAGRVVFDVRTLAQLETAIGRRLLPDPGPEAPRV